MRALIMMLGLALSICNTSQTRSINPQTLSPFAVFEADTLTTSGANVTAWPDKTGTAANDLGTTGSNPTYTASNALFNNRPTVDLSGSTSLQNATASRWKFLHDGSSWTCWMVVSVGAAGETQVPWSTNNNDGSNNGVAIQTLASNGRADLRYSNGYSWTLYSQRTRIGLVTTSPAIWVIRHVSGQGASVRYQGQEQYADANILSYGTSDAFEALKFGAFGGAMAEFGFIKSALSASDTTAVENYLASKYGVTLTARGGVSVFWSGNSMVGSAATFPDNVKALMTASLRSEHYQGISGQNLAQMVARDVDRIDPWINTEASRNIVFGWEGINQIAISGDTAAQAMTRLQTWAGDRRTAGFRVVIASMLPHTVVTEVDRTWWNAQLVAGEGDWFDALAAVHTDLDIGQAGQNADTTYFSDGIHLTDAGNAIAATYVAAAIDEAAQ